MDLRSKSSVADKVTFFEKLSNEEKISSSMNEDETKETRLLLVSNGFEICLLDIKLSRGKPRSNVDPLPKLATLNLVDEQLPVSVGLFRLGSDIYMIGGEEFPADFRSVLYPSTSSMCDKYKAFCVESSHKGTSSATYRLSFADGTLTPSKCNDMMRLRSPKFWPVVDEVDGKIHVFDSAPFEHFTPDDDWMFSHEVLDGCDSWCARAEPPLEDFITSHLVVDGHIFAVASNKFLLFDSVKLKWEVVGESSYGFSSTPLFFQTVWDILLNGYARCVEKISIGVVDWYLVIALVHFDQHINPGNCDDEDDPRVIVAAYLVTLTGDIVCTQILPNFFKGPVQPFKMTSGTIIKGDPDTQGGKTMCVILTGSAMREGGGRPPGYFFSNTFTVELVTDAASKVRTAGRVLWNEELVRVDITGRCIYRINTRMKDSDLAHLGRMQACFL